MTTQKTRSRTDCECNGKTISKKNQIKKSENRCQNDACEQKTNKDKLKFGSNKKLGLELTMNGLGKPFRNENPIQNIPGRLLENSRR